MRVNVVLLYNNINICDFPSYFEGFAAYFSSLCLHITLSNKQCKIWSVFILSLNSLQHQVCVSCVFL